MVLEKYSCTQATYKAGYPFGVRLSIDFFLRAPALQASLAFSNGADTLRSKKPVSLS